MNQKPNFELRNATTGFSYRTKANGWIKVGMVYLLLIVSPFCSNSQIDSLFYTEAENCTIGPLDTSECNLGINDAIELYAKGTFFFKGADQFRNTSFNTEDYLLEYKYKLIPRGSSDLFESQNCCFILKGKAIVRERMGKDFFENVKFEADSLDNLNLGFVQPNFLEENGNIMKYLHCRLTEKLANNELEDFYIGVDILIDSKGASQLQFYDVETNENMNNKITDQIEEIMNESRRWTPAKFKNKNIAIKYTTFVNSELIKNLCP